MSTTPIERIQTMRPLAAEAAALATGRVVPVVPVNPPLVHLSASEPTPGVVNLVKAVDSVNKTSAGEGVYNSVSDPIRPGAEAATPPKDWTIKRPVPEKVEDPPPEPLSKILLDHIKSLWEASASAVQVQQQVRNQLEPQPLTNAAAAHGVISNEVYNFSPTKINKIEKTQN